MGKPELDERIGECHYEPPTKGGWPESMSEDFCGKFEWNPNVHQSRNYGKKEPACKYCRFWKEE